VSFDKLSSKITQWTGTPLATGLAVAFVTSWAVGGLFLGFSQEYQIFVNTATTIVTFVMVFFIQAAQNRDTMAMHVKLDAIVAALEEASNRVIAAEGEDYSRLKAMLEEYHALDGVYPEEVEHVGQDDRTGA
jgi:low affinity Fe/Cu permease